MEKQGRGYPQKRIEERIGGRGSCGEDRRGRVNVRMRGSYRVGGEEEEVVGRS